ncbi:Uncharacterised protein [Raoultella terrigena]|uniref:Uncharacterized protein n=1 Tax=Raoultella terrigena TaxID=577 RepID=A0A3P8JYP9_RAOTE|nr:Uncharacterised protein [Raoultella terrigena]
MTEILRVLQEGLVMHGQHYARKKARAGGKFGFVTRIFHPERPHESLNNLTPEDHLLMAGKTGTLKKCVELKQVCITPPHVEETRLHQKIAP